MWCKKTRITSNGPVQSKITTNLLSQNSGLFANNQKTAANWPKPVCVLIISPLQGRAQDLRILLCIYKAFCARSEYKIPPKIVALLK